MKIKILAPTLVTPTEPTIGLQLVETHGDFNIELVTPEGQAFKLVGVRVLKDKLQVVRWAHSIGSRGLGEFVEFDRDNRIADWFPTGKCYRSNEPEPGIR